MSAPPSGDVSLIAEAARAAGSIAMARFGGLQDAEKKADGSPVTETDLAVDRFLRAALTEARPDYGWRSEETPLVPEERWKEAVFIVDPIDGTRAFMKGEPYFCICIAIARAGRPTQAAIYAPAFDELFLAEAGAGATLNGEALSASGAETLEGCRMIGDAGMFAHPAWRPKWPDMQLASPKPNAVAYRLALVAAGRHDATLALWRKADWDLAAATLIVEEAGGRATDHLGRPFRFDRPSGLQPSVVASGPALHPLLIERVQNVRLPEV